MTEADPTSKTPVSSLAAEAVGAIAETYAEVRDQTLRDAEERYARLEAERDALVRDIEARYREIADEIQVVRNENDTLSVQQEALEEERRALESQRNALQTQLDEEREALARLAKDSSDAAAAMQQRLQEERDEARRGQAEAESAREVVEGKLEDSREQVSALETQLLDAQQLRPADADALRALAPALRRALQIIDQMGLQAPEPIDGPETDKPGPDDEPRPDDEPPPPPPPPGALPRYALDAHEAFQRPTLSNGVMLFNGWMQGARPGQLLDSARNWVLFRKNGTRRPVVPSEWTHETLSANIDLMGPKAAVRLRQADNGRGWFLHFHEEVFGDSRWHTLLEVVGRGGGSLVRLWSGCESSRAHALGDLPYFLRDGLQQVGTMGPGFPYSTRHRISLSQHDVADFADAYFKRSVPYFSMVFLGGDSRFPTDLHSRLIQSQRLPSNPALVFALQDQEAAHALREALGEHFPNVRLPSSKALNRQVTFVSAAGTIAAWDRPEVRAIHTEQNLGQKLLSTLASIDARWLELTASAP